MNQGLVFIKKKGGGEASITETSKLWGSVTYFHFILQFRNIEKYQPTLWHQGEEEIKKSSSSGLPDAEL